MQSDKSGKDYLNFSEDYDLNELKSVVAYFDDLFVDYSKILVVRVDLGYQACEADKITFERAHRIFSASSTIASGMPASSIASVM